MPIPGDRRLTQPLWDNRVYFGIDPGQSGGLAALWLNSTQLEAMPATETDVWSWLSHKWGQEQFGSARVSRFAVIEKVHAMPGNGVSSMFKFGMGYGGLRMALIAAQIPFEEVTPQRWQKCLGIPVRKRDESKTDFKNRLRAKAQQLFPGVSGVSLKTADALLIAEYCRRKNEGRL